MNRTLPTVVHNTGLRTRLKWKVIQHPDCDIDYLQAWLENYDAIESVRVNKRGNSIVIIHDGSLMPEQLVGLFSALPETCFDSAREREQSRELADVVSHIAMAMGVPFLPTLAAAPMATAMGMPAIFRGIDTLVNNGLKVPVLDMSTIGFSLLRGDYPAAASISAMIVVGEYLRSATEADSADLLKKLITPQVESVLVERVGNDAKKQRVTIRYDEVVCGDVVICHAGDVIPVDGTLCCFDDETHSGSGDVLVDSSSLTGEPLPLHVGEGDGVLSGWTVLEGTLHMTAERIGGDTEMARLASYMERAVREKSRPERESDRLADKLTPLTLGMGALLYAATGDAARALSVLTIDYACAVKLPAPAVVRTSMYAAGRMGVLVKSGSALDALALADTFVFDKTGTLTTGLLEVCEVIPFNGFALQDILQVGVSLANGSTHPVSKGIRKFAKGHCVDVGVIEKSRYIMGKGTFAYMDNRPVCLGSVQYFERDLGISLDAVQDQVVEFTQKGKSIVCCGIGGKLAGIIVLQDSLRTGVSQFFRELRQSGVKRIVVLTGDSEQSARALFEGIDGEFGPEEKFCGIDEMRAGLLPEQKAAVVQELQQQGAHVAFVGDGVNDAAAFIEANVGVCMPEGASTAREAAGIVLSEGGLAEIVGVRLLGRRALQILRTCFATGVTVNSLLLLVAGAGKLDPLTAAAIHNFTTFAILGGATQASRSTVAVPQLAP
ncbi:MAG: heavy metal translocating P-type ATPase [Desulfovibrio sp.]